MTTEEHPVKAEIIEEPGCKLKVVYTEATIEDNLSALDAYVQRQIAMVSGAQIDIADRKQVSDARKVMAALNSLKKPIEDERKRVKRVYEEPLKRFEARVGEITAKIDTERSALKAQVDAATERFREQRKAELHEEYVNIAGEELANLIPFDAVLEAKWLNSSTTQSAALSALADKAASSVQGYRALESKSLVHKQEVLALYCRTLDMTSALQLEDELIAQDKRMEEFARVREEAEAVRKQREDIPEPVFKWAFSTEFEGTRGKATQLARALKALGIHGTITNEGAIQ